MLSEHSQTEQENVTESSVKTVTQAELNRMLAKEKGTGERHILSLFGLESKDQITEYLGNIDVKSSEIDRLKGELLHLKCNYYLKEKGIPDDKLQFVKFVINESADISDFETFTNAVEEYLSVNPINRETVDFKISLGSPQSSVPPKRSVNQIMNRFIRN